MKKIIIVCIFMGISLCSSPGIQISSQSHTLALKDGGTVWAWGYNRSGQLGNGRADKTGSNPTPVQVSGLTDVIAIGTGLEYSLAVKRDGTVWAWGQNYYGQLGNGTRADQYIPVQVVGLFDVIAVSGGSDHTLALKNDGTVWAWGWGAWGRLGDGTMTDHWTPVQVVGFSEGSAIAAGASHSLALKRDGTVWAWGNNLYGQLGDGTYEARLLPVQVIGLSNVISISSGGSDYALALKEDGTVWAWGLNGKGVLGDGNAGLTNNSPIPVQSLISGVIAIQAGAYSYALTSYGTVWWWGRRLLHFMHPIIVAESAIPIPLDGIANVKAIGGSGASFALKNDGTVWAWGVNPYGSIGDGTTIDQPYPVKVQIGSVAGSSTLESVLAADFDGDGKDDPTAISSSGELFYWNSSQSFSRHGPQTLGSSGTPAVGDADGDGRPDLATVSGQAWYFFLSNEDGSYTLHGPEYFGQTGTPLLADFDGDGKADPCVVTSSGVWHVWLSGRGYELVSGSFAVSGATPAAADFDADGRADPVMVDANGNWYLWPSSQMYTQHGPYNFQLTGKPVAGDFDGDGKADPGIVDSSGNWNLFLSSSFYLRNGPWYLVLP